MKQFKAFIKKEFFHILRDRQTVLILILMPVVQTLLFGFAITTDINNTSVIIVDNAKDGYSKKLITAFDANKYFIVEDVVYSYAEAEKYLKKGLSRLCLIIPADFEKAIEKKEKINLQIVADASNPNEASILTNYTNGIVAKYMIDINIEQNIKPIIEVNSKMLYNPQLKSAYNFVPGVIGLVLMLICTLMTSVSLVREKELGTMEVLLASPSRPIYIILSKTVPYFVISLFNIITILLLAVFAFKVPINGSIGLLLATSITYIFTSLALGLLISSISKTQQIAMIISLVGLMLPTMLLSGLMFPIENMPTALQIISNIVPATWFIQMVKDIMIKGLGFMYFWKDWAILLSMMIIFVFISFKRFKIRL